MKTMRYMAAALAAAMLLSATGCKGGAESRENAGEIEAARIDGREAARKFLNRPWRDTVELQRQLLEARALQSRYQKEGRTESARAFDSAFVSTLKTVRPDVAGHLERAMNNAPQPRQPQ